ncbi:MAG: CDP-glucose 4,6-dehydratase [Burkholderiales bacterium]|nr:CDP-glucose 4,6-dehydratase [Opitutaceae bacterium]
MSFADIYRGKRVLLTGHTGFKGAWLAEWLLSLGAEVTGFALPPPTSPSLFEQLGLAARLRHIEGDVRDLTAVRAAVAVARPDFVFHLAAQPLVRLSYEQPTETFAANVMGTANVLESVRLAADPAHPCAVVAITTDKCYENREWVHSYREEDPMGGYDPYSASKGAAELVISSYRRSYFSAPDSPIRLASARAGNVIGGGDWALDRIVPDCIRALAKGDSIPVRNKVATRPWQHVLEPLSGYLWLGAALAFTRSGSADALSSDSKARNGATVPLHFPASTYASAFNFGPALASNRTVAELVQEILKHWPGRWEDKSDPRALHEAKLLNLATDKSHHFLGWSPAWPFAETIAQTVGWYKDVESARTDAGKDAPGRTSAGAPSVHTLTTGQIAAYTFAARAAGIPWAAGVAFA